MQTDISKLFQTLRLEFDRRGAKITPGCLRKSGRQIALEANIKEATLDAIGGWKQRSVSRQSYQDFELPAGFSDIVLKSDELLKTIKEKGIQNITLSYCHPNEWENAIEGETDKRKSSSRLGEACSVGFGEATSGSEEDEESNELSSQRTMSSKPKPTEQNPLFCPVFD